MKTDVLGVRFDALTLTEAAEAASAMLDRGEGGTIVTANPEIVLRTRKDGAYRRAVNGADLVLADGVGDLYAARILGRPLPERVAGSDLVPALLERMAERGQSVFLYGAKPGVSERAALALERQYPGLRVAGTENGYIKDETGLWHRLEAERPDLLLLGLGAPKQERWMAAHRRETRAVMIGVGGLLDVFAGDVPRAPETWRRAGLEWLYRALRQPSRVRRIAKLPLILVLAAGERLRGGGGETDEKGE